MRERLAKIPDPAARAKVFHTAAKLLGQCPPPSATGGKAVGLALGKVQSGKTSSFITLAAQAFDNGYRAVIVLAGTKNNLLRQNTDRIREELAEGREMDLIVTSTERGADTLHPQDIVQLVKRKRPVIITVLKRKEHIRQVMDTFAHPDLKSVPVLIIDDEGDQASLNTKKPPRRNASQGGGGPQKSPTNKAITELLDTLTHRAFIAYTATPQANLLIDTLTDLTPHFCVLVEPGPGYTGGSTFHGQDQDLYTREVTTNEHSDREQVDEESLEYAMATFLVGAVVRGHKSDVDHHSMLIHTSHRTADHQEVCTLVESKRQDWSEYLALPDGDAAKTSLLRTLRAGYEDLCTTVADIPPWDEIVLHLRDALEDCKTWMVNSSEQGQSPNPKNMPFRNNIFIGGNMLDRGVTVPGLAVTYVTRWAKENQADTVEQRARWFGYKERYLDVCRIWAPRPVLDGFAALLGHEDDLWQSLRRWEEANRSVKDWPRLLRLDDESLRPTRATVASFSEVKLNTWTIQYRADVDRARAAENLELVRNFFQGVGAKATAFGPQTHLIAENVARSVFQNGLLKRLHQVDPLWNGDFLEALFERLATKYNLGHFDLIWLENNEERNLRTRTLDNGTIPSLLQGHNNTYQGDRNLRPNYPQIQVHTPMLKSDQRDLWQAVFLAYCIPNVDGGEVRLIRGNG